METQKKSMAFMVFYYYVSKGCESRKQNSLRRPLRPFSLLYALPLPPATPVTTLTIMYVPTYYYLYTYFNAFLYTM